MAASRSSNPQARDLILQLLERFVRGLQVVYSNIFSGDYFWSMCMYRILSSPKARPVLLNGAVRKGERLVPSSAFDLLIHAAFPVPSARIKVSILVYFSVYAVLTFQGTTFNLRMFYRLPKGFKLYILSWRSWRLQVPLEPNLWNKWRNSYFQSHSLQFVKVRSLVEPLFFINMGHKFESGKNVYFLVLANYTNFLFAQRNELVVYLVI